MKGILGKKLGMTQIFTEEGIVVPVTVVEAGPNVVTQVKTVEKDGYNAIQVGFEDAKEKSLNKPQKGHLAAANTLKKHLKEFRVDSVEGYTVGQEIKADLFTAGEMIDVTGISKGKGFQGPIKDMVNQEVQNLTVLDTEDQVQWELVLTQVEFSKTKN